MLKDLSPCEDLRRLVGAQLYTGRCGRGHCGRTGSSFLAPCSTRLSRGRGGHGRARAAAAPESLCCELPPRLLMRPHPGSGDLDPSYPGSVRVMPHNELALVSGSRNSEHKGTAVFGSFGGTSEGLRR